MARRYWVWLLAAVVVLPLLAWCFDRVQEVRWVGSTDLQVAFAVTDATSGNPIPGARVEIQSDGGFYEEREKQEFALTADGDGMARKVCRNSMCFGTRSGLGVKDTFVVHLPWWRFRAVAPDYEPGAWVELEAPEYIRQVRRAGPRKAALLVAVALHKNSLEPGAAPAE